MKRNTRRALCFSLALCLCLALFAMMPPGASAETGIKKVLIQTGNGGTPPVVWLELQYFPTKTSTEGCYISSAQWYYADHTPVTGRFKDDTEVYLVVYVDASPGYVFNDDARCYINGSEATYTKISPTSRRVESHKYKPEVWAAAVYKNPTGETIDPGGWASFVVSGGYVQDYQWCIRTPDKRHWYTLDEAKSEATVVEGAHVPKDFLQVTWTGEDTDRLILSNIPADMDGYYVFCRLSSYNQISWTPSGDAKITVNQPTPKPTPEPTPEPTPSPTPEPTPSPTPKPSPSPSPTPEPTEEPKPLSRLRPDPGRRGQAQAHARRGVADGRELPLAPVPGMRKAREQGGARDGLDGEAARCHRRRRGGRGRLQRLRLHRRQGDPASGAGSHDRAPAERNARL